MKNFYKAARALAAALVIAPLSISAAHSAVLYGTIGNAYAGNSTLVTIDTVTGGITQIGSVGYVVNGLTWDSSTSTLYGSARMDGGLLKINVTTGAGSLVSAGFDSRSGGCSGHNVLLTANSTGNLFGWCDPSNDDLMSIDKVTGKATRVGESFAGTGQHGLAFDNNDNLFMFNGGTYYSVSTSTGAATHLGYFGGTAHHGDFNPDNNLYYGIGGMGIGIYDLAGGTGYQGYIGATGLHTIAFAGAAAADVPEPASLALFGLGLAGFMAARRKKAAKA